MIKEVKFPPRVLASIQECDKRIGELNERKGLIIGVFADAKSEELGGAALQLLPDGSGIRAEWPDVSPKEDNGDGA